MSSFAPFRHRAYLLVWLGAMVSNVGTWMETTALSYYVADTSKAAWSGAVAAAGFLPTALLSPVGGAWADRFRRRNVMIWANAASAVIAAAIAVLVASGNATPLLLAMFALLAGSANAIAFPSFQATLPDLVPPEELVAAIGLSSTQWNLGRIIGPTAAGIAIWLGGVPAALWCNAVSFFATIVAVILAKLPGNPRTRRQIVQAVRDGIDFARHNSAVRAMVPVMIAVTFVGGPFIGFVAQIATSVFGTKQAGTSFLVTMQGIGAVIAGASMGWLTKRFGLRRTMVGAVTLLGPALVAYGASPNIVIAGVALAVTGGAYMACISSFSSVTQQSAPAALRGRALAVNNFVLGIAYPAGLFVQGPIADATSLRTMTIASGLVLISLVVVARLLRPTQTEPIALALG